VRNIFSVLAALLSLVMVVPAYAVIYKWVDDKGVVNFTEDLGKVPQKYRKNVGIAGEDRQAEPSVVIHELKEEKRESAVGVGTGKDTVKNETGLEKKITFGGKEERYWKEEFIKTKYELKSVRDQIEAVNARMAKSDQMSRSEYKSLDNTRKILEEQELAARKRLDALNAEAKRAGVPPDIR
jgi:hypothetical protein